MAKKATDDDIKKFMDDHAGLFDDLANCIQCPCCKRKTRKPFFNLGPAFSSFEGCRECAEKHNPDGIKESS